MGLLKTFQIKNSAFYGENIRVDFSAKMNCVMGGRGTGKTTLLTILYWLVSHDDDLPKEMLSLVRSNLGSGTAELVFEDDLGNEFVVFKVFGDSPAIKNAAGEQVPFEDFAARVGIDFYSAGAIERIGLDPKHRLRLFDGYIGKDVSDINAQIGITVAQLKQSEVQIKASSRELSQLKEEMQTFGNIDEDLAKARAELTAAEANAELKAKFESENTKQTTRVIERNVLAKIRESNLNVSSQIERLRASVSTAVSILGAKSDCETPALKEFLNTGLERFQALAKLAEQLRSEMCALDDELTIVANTCRLSHDAADGEFSRLKQTIDKHREVFQKINTLSQRATAKKISAEKIQNLTEQLRSHIEVRSSLLGKLKGFVAARGELRRNLAEKVNELLGQKVKILMRENALNEPFATLLESIVSRLQMRMTGAERRMLEVSSPQMMVQYLEKNDPEGFAKRCEIQNVERVRTLFNEIGGTEMVYELEACVCEDAPNFFLCVEDEKKVESFKPTEELSTGQRCTAVLPVVFAMTARPLLIDQPEDNLDNRYITQSIQEIIQKTKKFRQMIFITHNPNIPVISDSEFNLFLSYYNQRAHVLSAGSVQDVKLQIVDLLEGGKEAFERRKNIYGY